MLTKYSPLAILALCLALALNTYAGVETEIEQIRLPAIISDADQYIREAYKEQILKASLDASADQFGPYQLTHDDSHLTPMRALYELKAPKPRVDLVFFPASQARNQIAPPIEIPIRKGLLNHRLLIVRKSDLEAFTQLRSTEQLKHWRAGLQHDWVITNILRSQGFNVVTAIDRENLFPMLRSKRFDYLLYGVNEAHKELEVRGSDEFTIVPGLTVYTNIPLYIYVARGKEALAKRVRYGLENIIANGTFDRIFEQHYAQIIEQAELEQRTGLFIDNPYLSPLTPLHRPELWFKLPTN